MSVIRYLLNTWSKTCEIALLEMISTNYIPTCVHLSVLFCKIAPFFFLLPMVSGHQTILVHHQTGIAAITATALGYQVSHLSAAKVASPVSENQTIKTCQNVSHSVKNIIIQMRFLICLLSEDCF